MDRTLPFDVPDHLCHRVLRRDRDQHVYVVGHQVPFLDSALALLRKSLEHVAQLAT